MHPSSFYDLWARYVYTPLHGPYTLFEALEGLIFYSLNLSWDFILIGFKRSLWHELSSEFSNIVDDLQDYLAYFSSKFLISPPDTLDLIKELQTNCKDFKYLIVCWGALITRLVTTHKIVECYFWPHFFHLAVNNPATFQGLGRPPSFILPNLSLDKLSMFASTSTFTLPPHSTPRSQCCPLERQLQPLNAQNECPEHP